MEQELSRPTDTVDSQPPVLGGAVDELQASCAAIELTVASLDKVWAKCDGLAALYSMARTSGDAESAEVLTSRMDAARCERAELERQLHGQRERQRLAKEALASRERSARFRCRSVPRRPVCVRRQRQSHRRIVVRVAAKLTGRATADPDPERSTRALRSSVGGAA